MSEWVGQWPTLRRQNVPPKTRYTVLTTCNWHWSGLVADKSTHWQSSASMQSVWSLVDKISKFSAPCCSMCMHEQVKRLNIWLCPSICPFVCLFICLSAQIGDITAVVILKHVIDDDICLVSTRGVNSGIFTGFYCTKLISSNHCILH